MLNRFCYFVINQIFMRNLFLFILLIILFSACKKKELTFTIKGKITDSTFSTGLSGAKLNIEEISSNGSTEGKIAEITIPENGEYELTFKRNSAIKYIVTITKANYFTITEHISFSDFSTEEPLVKNYSTTAKSWVKLIFNNLSPNSEFDLLRYIKQVGKEGCEECCSKTEQEIYGTGTTTRYCINDGNSKYSYYYWSENPSSQGLKEIITPAFDTVELILNY
jgi:hypothetical protein